MNASEISTASAHSELNRIAAAFAPFASLAGTLLPHVVDDAGDGSHDLSHLVRVWNNARRIHAQEGGDLRVLLAAVLLHDCVRVEKNSPLRSQASRLSAQRTQQILQAQGWSDDECARVAHAVEAHSFSAGIAPLSLEAKIIQDADRLDAIGAIGVARCFYVAGRMGSGLYDAADPLAQDRALDDKRYALDHFPAKLLRLASGFQTVAGAAMAARRQSAMEQFMAVLSEEIVG
ncbi:HD domain-containing protein [Herbaspirillum sp. LeCh32-8]|uniref:HD domain-containing protein n=1 Tax=Herbaspirillum sp. LeCh32-8 TaxID=2821356 RepID=UPI001AE802C3|nr:HD domain-containing protein [Herbaspirillum sp. LeCh32-8]MBP0598954.1 HD domain-containing protein [Herbaspirillum sp. LeCh32-8]